MPPSSVVLQTRDWASLTVPDGRSYIEVAPGESLKRQPPASFGGPLDWRIRRNLEAFNPPLFVVTVPQGRVVGRSGAVITADNCLLGDLSSDWFFQPQQHPLFFRLKLPPIQPLPGTILNFARLSGWNYAHWVLDVLPRLDILRRAGVDWRKAGGCIFNGPVEDFKTDTLDLLGFPRENRHFTGATTHFQCERLITPSLPCKPNETPSWVVDFLRRSFVTAAKTPHSPDRIYISRSKTSFRNVLNDSAVVELLARRGFKSVCCEDLSFREKVDLFASRRSGCRPARRRAGASGLLPARNHGHRDLFAPLCQRLLLGPGRRGRVELRLRDWRGQASRRRQGPSTMPKATSAWTWANWRKPWPISTSDGATRFLGLRLLILILIVIFNPLHATLTLFVAGGNVFGMQKENNKFVSIVRPDTRPPGHPADDTVN